MAVQAARGERPEGRSLPRTVTGLLWGAGLAGAWVVAGAGMATADVTDPLATPVGVTAEVSSDVTSAVEPVGRSSAAVVEEPIAAGAAATSTVVDAATTVVKQSVDAMERDGVEPAKNVLEPVAQTAEPVTRMVEPVTQAVEPLTRTAALVEQLLDDATQALGGTSRAAAPLPQGVPTGVLGPTADSLAGAPMAVSAARFGADSATSSGLPQTLSLPTDNGSPWHIHFTGLATGLAEGLGGAGGSSASILLYAVVLGFALLGMSSVQNRRVVQGVAGRPGTRPD